MRFVRDALEAPSFDGGVADVGSGKVVSQEDTVYDPAQDVEGVVITPIARLSHGSSFGMAAIEVRRVWRCGINLRMASKRTLAKSSTASSGASFRSEMASLSEPV